MFMGCTFGFFAVGAGIVSPLAGGSLYDFYDVTSGTASVSWRFQSDGTVTALRSGAPAAARGWFEPAQAGVGASYWIRATTTSGTAPSGAAMGTWISLASSVVWNKSVSPNAFLSGSFLVEISTTNSTAGLVTSGTYSYDVDANLL